MSNHSKVNGLLEGKQDCYLIGGGPSLAGFDFSRLDDKFTIAINHTIEYYDNVKCLLFGDKIFLNKTTYPVSEFKGMIFCSEHCETNRSIQHMLDDIFFFEPRKDEPTHTFKKGLFHPTSSGILALNLAVIMNAKNIFLLGYDYFYDNGNTHFFGNIYEHHARYQEERTMKKVYKFRPFSGRKNIFNCSPNSRIDFFPKITIEEALR